MPYTLHTLDGPIKVHNCGEKGSGLIWATERQSYVDIKNCLDGCMFEDPFFELSFGPKLEGIDIEWLRPKEIVDKPQFIQDGMSRFDVDQGRIGDCWLLAALADLTQRPKHLDIVIPRDQDFGKGYAGIFHFRFWNSGRWVDIPIDDRLPTVNKKLVSVKSSDKNEFWSALLEKAYAKMYGSYGSIIGGFTCEALQNLTGGVVKFIFPNNPDPVKTLNMLQEAHLKEACMGAAIMSQEEDRLREKGLVVMHAYSITKIEWIVHKVTGQRIPLIRLRNPWGKVEWNGPWSDNSPKWEISVDNQTRNRLRDDKENGEFWMEYKDFVKYFNLVDICFIQYPESRPGIHHLEGQEWEVDCLDGEWISPMTAGGSRVHWDSFWKNPKVSFKIVKKAAMVTIALLQKHRRALRAMDCTFRNLSIGLTIYKVEDIHQPLDEDFFQTNDCFASTTFSNMHENALEIKAEPGYYVVVPSTAQPDQVGQFLLRVMIQKDVANTPSRTSGKKISWINQYAEQVPPVSPTKVAQEKAMIMRLVNRRPKELSEALRQWVHQQSRRRRRKSKKRSKSPPLTTRKRKN